MLFVSFNVMKMDSFSWYSMANVLFNAWLRFFTGGAENSQWTRSIKSGLDYRVCVSHRRFDVTRQGKKGVEYSAVINVVR